jgi:hypothetical protein
MNEEQKREIDDYISGTSVRPPHGSVFDDLDLKSGPPMLRMIILQIAFAFVSKLTMFKPRTKALMIGMVCAFFLYTDMTAFMEKRNPNLYNLVGFERNSDIDFI